MKRTVLSLSSCFAILLALTACAPGASLVQSPTFRFITDGSGLQRLEPVGAGGEAVFRLNLEVTNPNPIGLKLAGLDFDLALNGQRAATSSFNGGLQLAAGGTSPLALDVRVPLADALRLASDLAGLIAGQPTEYGLTGTVTLDVLGSHQRLPSARLASGTITQPLGLVAPRIRYLPEASGLRELSFNRAVIEVGLELSNPGPLGYLFTAPDVNLRLGPASVAGGRVVSKPVPAFGEERVTLRFEFNPVSLGAGFYAQLASLSAGSNLELAVSGDFSLEIPGITTRSFSAATLASGILR